MRFTPEKINSLASNEIFTFGANERGCHGAGAAKFAMDKFGAVYGVGFGLQGKTFAIPTKDWDIKTLTLGTIGFYIRRFLEFAKLHPDITFLVTKLGTGLAGLQIQDVARLFVQVRNEKIENVILPVEFWNELIGWDELAEL